jgi:predicted nucleic acid-binding protein
VLVRDPVGSNTTPLIKLVGVRLLDLLPTLYQEIHVPEAVFAEYQAGCTLAVLILQYSPGSQCIP